MDAGSEAAAEAGEGLDEVQQQRASVERAEGDQVDVSGDDEDATTARRRKKPRSSYLQAGSRKRAAKRALTRTMAEWEETCKQLRLPSDSREFCDFVLVFDVLDQDDVTEPSCCSYCEQSPREVEECLDVRVVHSLLVLVLLPVSLSWPRGDVIFDEMVEDDVTEASNRTGCCSCCKPSPKEVKKSIEVRIIQHLVLD